MGHTLPIGTAYVNTLNNICSPVGYFIQNKMEHFTIFSTKLKQMFSTVIRPVLTSGLYYSDLITDILMTINLYRNCHIKYFITSMVILPVHYFTTVLFLKFRTKTDWTAAFIYPYHYGKDHLYLTVLFKGYFYWNHL